MRETWIKIMIRTSKMNCADLVKTKCAQAAEVGMRGDAWTHAMRACMQRFVQANGKGKHQCQLSPKDVPDVPPKMFSIDVIAKR